MAKWYVAWFPQLESQKFESFCRQTFFINEKMKIQFQKIPLIIKWFPAERPSLPGPGQFAGQSVCPRAWTNQSNRNRLFLTINTFPCRIPPRVVWGARPFGPNGGGVGPAAGLPFAVWPGGGRTAQGRDAVAGQCGWPGGGDGNQADAVRVCGLFYFKIFLFSQLFKLIF